MSQEPLVADYMDKNFMTFSPDLSINKAMNILVKKRLIAALVVDEQGLPQGLLAENDCLKVLLNQTYYNSQEPEDMVKNYMQKVPDSIPSTMTILEAADIFLKNRFRRLPVIDSGKLVGQITRRDLLRAMHKELFLKK
ncbi:MAG: CBS domain-containing protein [Deltaproteobacteria bacterium]|nr:CBS domain-containing protein [Deltaproteobacteria bacterium]